MRSTLLSALVFFFVIVSGGAHAQPYAPTTGRPAVRPGPVTMPFKSARFQGKRALVLAYSIDNPRASEAVAFLQDMAGIKNEFNFEVAGVNINADRQAEVRRFQQEHGATFPVAFDTNGDLARHLRLRGDLTLYVFNKQGVRRGTVYAASVPAQKSLKRAFRAYVDRIFNLGFIPDDEPVLGDRPPVPVFEAPALDGTTISLRHLYEKKPVVLVFFSPTCGHCRHELQFLQELLKTAEFKNAFTVVAVSRHNRDVTEKFVREAGFSFACILDTGDAVSSLFESFVGVVPVAYIIDTSGRIFAKHTGFSDRMRDLYYMELRHLLGLPNKPLLVPRGYSGQERCQICHEQQHMQWSLTGHSYAIASVRRKGREDDPACIGCHVTGWGRPGGYRLDDRGASRHLENVQCEACHGPGYQSCAAFTGVARKKKSVGQWKALCLSCHTDKESLNFNFARRFPEVVHGNMPDLSGMNRQQRIRLLRQHTANSNPFSNPAAYVGAQACRKCHEPQYRQWSTTVHAAVGSSSDARNASEDKKFRYTTGYGLSGGYPAQGMEGVQCEACHGPAGRHIKEPEKKGQDYIVSLGDQCDSCVVEQICRSCHGPQDDPDFQFERYKEKVRHTARP